MHSPDSCIPTALLLLAVPNNGCPWSTVRQFRAAVAVAVVVAGWHAMLPSPNADLVVPVTHTLVVVVEHIPGQVEGIWGIQHVWQEQLRVHGHAANKDTQPCNVPRLQLAAQMH
jgi:hypothetical protein